MLRYADNDELRREVWTAFNKVATQEPHDNHGLVGQILKLRQEKAELLGFDNFADLALERRMAKTGDRALIFEDDLHAKIKQQCEQENGDLDAFRAEQSGIEVERMEPWDVAYWADKYRKSKYDFDSESLRPYFPVDQVLTGMFEITQKLFGVSIREAEAIHCATPTTENSVLHRRVRP